MFKGFGHLFIEWTLNSEPLRSCGPGGHGRSPGVEGGPAGEPPRPLPASLAPVLPQHLTRAAKSKYRSPYVQNKVLSGVTGQPVGLAIPALLLRLPGLYWMTSVLPASLSPPPLFFFFHCPLYEGRVSVRLSWSSGGRVAGQQRAGSGGCPQVPRVTPCPEPIPAARGSQPQPGPQEPGRPPSPVCGPRSSVTTRSPISR